jgi:hypothetical protein
MTGGLASPPESRVNSPMVVTGAASASCLGSIPPPKFFKPSSLHGHVMDNVTEQEFAELGDVEDEDEGDSMISPELENMFVDPLPSEEELDGIDDVVEEFSEKTLSNGGGVNPRMDVEVENVSEVLDDRQGDVSNVVRPRQPSSEAEDQGLTTTLTSPNLENPSRDLSDAVVDRVVDIVINGVEPILSVVDGSSNTTSVVEDVIMKVVESNVPEVSVMHNGREDGIFNWRKTL